MWIKSPINLGSGGEGDYLVGAMKIKRGEKNARLLNLSCKRYLIEKGRCLKPCNGENRWAANKLSKERALKRKKRGIFRGTKG